MEGGSKDQKKIKLDTNQGGSKGEKKLGKKKSRKLQEKYGESSKNNFLGGHHGSGGRQPYSHQDIYGGGRMDFYRQGPPGSYAEGFGNNFRAFRGGYGRGARGGFYDGVDFGSQKGWSPWQQHQWP